MNAPFNFDKVDFATRADACMFEFTAGQGARADGLPLQSR